MGAFVLSGAGVSTWVMARKQDWVPEAGFVVIILGTSLIYVIIRFWPF